MDSSERPFTHWRRAREFVLGGRKNLWRAKLGSAELAPGVMSRSWNPTPLFLRETNTVLTAEAELPHEGAAPRAFEARRQWLLRLEIEGEGYVQVQVQPRGTGAQPRLVADRPIGVAEGVQVLQRRLLIDAQAQRLDLRLEHRAASHLRVLRASLVPVCAS